MVAGYTQFKSLPDTYNLGFPYMTDFRVVDDLQFALKHNGIYQVKLTFGP